MKGGARSFRKQLGTQVKLHWGQEVVGFFQEVQRWEDNTCVGKLVLRTAEDCACGVLVPRNWLSRIKAVDHTKEFYAVVLDEVLLVSAYLPDSSKGLDMFSEALDDFAHFVKRLRRAHHVSHVLCGADLQTAMPQDDVVVGPRTLFQTGTADRLQRALAARETLADLGLRAMNTWGEECASHSEQRWTHAGAWGRRENKQQLDYILASQHVGGAAGPVETGLFLPRTSIIAPFITSQSFARVPLPWSARLRVSRRRDGSLALTEPRRMFSAWCWRAWALMRLAAQRTWPWPLSMRR